QVYVPSINAMLFVAVVVLTLGFGSSAALATAYGLSVTGTMLIDTLLLAVVAYTTWPTARRWVLPLCTVFFTIDVAFLLANGAKLFSGFGAWVPLIIGVVAFTLMRTWRRGRELLHAEFRKKGIRSQTFVPELMLNPPVRVPGTAVFLTSDKGMVPPALLHNLKHNKVLHERNIFLTVQSVPKPHVPNDSRLTEEIIGTSFHAITIRYGFMEAPDVPQALMSLSDRAGMVFDPMDSTYFTSRETVLGGRHRGMAWWRDRIFGVMHRNAAPASDYFHIPPASLMEVGSQVQI
ncbi:MAG: KUP/HAK/KT family potassium transporter, partial [Arenimonas sp.]